MTSSVPVVQFDAYTPRVAIVTGASRGIGRAIALRLADDGIDVAINDISALQDDISKVVEEVRQKGRQAIAVPADVSVEADVISMVEKTAKELGSVDIVGVFPILPPVCCDAKHRWSQTPEYSRLASSLKVSSVSIRNLCLTDVFAQSKASVEKFKKVTDVNLLGVFMCFKYSAIQMIKQGHGGRLIGLS